jgi:ParB family chromosome partitioning protein
MIEEYGYTQEKLAKVIGKARTTVTESLTLNKLPEDLRKKCRTSDISKSVLLEIAKQKNKKAMFSLYETVKDGGLKNRAVRDITRAPRVKRTPTIIAIERVKICLILLAASILNHRKRGNKYSSYQCWKT